MKIEKKAFSLIETILSIGFISFVSLVVVSFIVTSNYIRKKNALEFSLLRNAEVLEHYIVTAIANADTVTSPLPGSSDAILSFVTSHPEYQSPITISLQEKRLVAVENSAQYPLSPDTVEISNFSVEHSTSEGELYVTYTISAREKIGTRLESITRNYTFGARVRKY